MNQRQLFLEHIAQTSDGPLMLEIDRADGCWLYDIQGKKFLDLISGIAVANIGHNNSAVKNAVNLQVEKYMHIMVYGEFVESPQVQYAKWLTGHLSDGLTSVYFTNSGSEAVEGALKLAKRCTGRSEIISFRNAYHGSTMGALSAGNNEERKNAFRPLIPDNRVLDYNDVQQLKHITSKTACVLIEPLQAEAGVILPEPDFLQAVRDRCDATGALLLLDECQTGFGRTGSLFAHQKFSVRPDVLILGKALGGGMPLGAFISAKKIMDVFTNGPVLGHITTFGGHPVCCAAGLAAAMETERLQVIEQVEKKAALFNRLLVHSLIMEVRNCGLMFAVQFKDADFNLALNKKMIEAGVLTDWFLFAPDCMRIAPPLTITDEEIGLACSTLIGLLNEASAL